jgi:hypothetical protein
VAVLLSSALRPYMHCVVMFSKFMNAGSSVINLSISSRSGVFVVFAAVILFVAIFDVGAANVEFSFGANQGIRGACGLYQLVSTYPCMTKERECKEKIDDQREESPYKCNIWDSAFSDRAEFERHQNSTHREQQSI